MYEIIATRNDGAYVGAVAGMGKNRGTWDTTHSRSAAYRHLRSLRLDPRTLHDCHFRVVKT